jgi:hypothetical protein
MPAKAKLVTRAIVMGSNHDEGSIGMQQDNTVAKRSVAG